ncbi:MAG: LptF/LptG family permease, partial [Bacteroidota bacterium]
QLFKEITIHDHTDPAGVKTIKAKEGEVFKSKNGSFLFFKLTDGEVFEELASNQASEVGKTGHFYPSRRSSFKTSSYKIDLSGFKINRTDEDLFKNQYEMWNVFQINHALDSIQKSVGVMRGNFFQNIKNDHIYFQSYTNIEKAKSEDKTSTSSVSSYKEKTQDSKTVKIEELDKTDLILAYQNAISKIRRKNQNLDSQKEFMNVFQVSLNQFETEFHKKFALTFAIFVLFFVGAPLGAIVKKGGFGAPVVIAALLFMLYYVLTEIGLGLAESKTVSPFVGVWLATFVLIPIALLLMRSAALDSKVFDKEAWKKTLKLRKK